MQLTFEDYKKKSRACFLGKAVGGTIGMPFEGNRNTHSVTYYDPVPTEMLPNDDLDLQVVWLEAIRENGLPINRKHLAEAWIKHVGYHFDEYGTAIRNIKNYMQPPLSGYYTNRFYAGMGAAIRAELWACIAPANPDLAVLFAREDACVDHFADGVDGTVFITAIESAAFVESDMNKLLEIGLSYIPAEGRMARAVRDVVAWCRETDDMFTVREKILEVYGTCEWEKQTINWSDVVINVAFTVLAWICGKGDFSACICNATNLGYDTDCTAGIIASILAIIDPDCIEERWIRPIGTDVVVSCLLVGMHNKTTIDAFCEDIDNLCLDVQKYYKTGIFDGVAAKHSVPVWTEAHSAIALPANYDVKESLICVEPLAVRLFYPENIALIPEVAAPFSATVINTASTSVSGKVKLSMPDGWTVTPDSFPVSLAVGEGTELSFSITAPESDIVSYLNTLRFEFDVCGLRFHAEAGIQLAIPWRVAVVDELPKTADMSLLQNAEIRYGAGAILGIPSGEKMVAAVDFKLWHFQGANCIIAAQGVPLTGFIDGVEVISHESEFYTPSPHRFECSATYEIRGGWHTAYFAIDNSECNSPELYFWIGNMGGRTWWNDIEWKKTK